MATITPTVTQIGTSDDRCYVTVWAAITPGDTCDAVQNPMHRCVQFSGTFGGATIVIQGSNDGTNYVTLTDPQGNAISKTAAAIEQLEEITRYVKPVISGGSGSSITVTMLSRRGFR